ncbi:MAG: HTTM domain-containing protein [Myxococcales bacterium]|nr:HTTM domain-containing protein [Myxococcales bacterium]
MIRWWVALWDRKEAPTVLGLIRIGVALVLLGDFLTMWGFGIVDDLYTSPASGGLAIGAQRAWWVGWFGATPGSARLLHGLLVASSASLAIGLFSRTSALTLLLLYAQSAQILPDADRAIDTLLRNILMILVFAPCGAIWSVDAWLRTGRFAGRGELVGAWARYLIVLQLVLMYFTAGVQKYAMHWWPWGEFSALYVILNDWAYAKYDFGWLSKQPFYLLTQLSTAITMFFQWTYPVVLIHYFPPDRPARGLRRLMQERHLHWLWIGVGAFFHVGIAGTMALGIFPWGMLVLYPAYLHPTELDALVARVRGLLGRLSGGAPSTGP